MMAPSGKNHISIRMTVISAIVLATVLTASVAIGLQYYFGHKLATEVTRNIYTAAASGIATELRAIGEKNSGELELLAGNSTLSHGNAETAQLQIFTGLMEKNPLYYGIYLGMQDGRFYEVINLESSHSARAALQAESGDRWVVLKIEDKPGVGLRRYYSYLNDALEVRSRRSEATDYQTTTRPWYVSALNSDQIQRTAPYVFAQLGVQGQSSSMRVGTSGTVVAIDLTLQSMSRYLSSLDIARSSDIFMYNRNGEIIASSSSDSANRKAPIEKLIEIANDPAQRELLVEIEHRNEPYYAYAAPLAALDERDMFVGILEPMQTVTGPILDKVLLSIYITGGLLLLLLPLVWLFSTPIVNPIKQLALENDKVRIRDFEQVRRIPTHVTELDELSESMVTMVSSIQEHEKAQAELMESIIKLIAQAIDDKSAYTGGHCERVPELAMMLADRASNSEHPPFRDFRLNTDDQWREYRIAAWLHDCGKITTPEHVVDKGSKLEAIYNRIHEVRMRFEVLWRDAQISYWEALRDQPQQEHQLQQQLKDSQQRLQEDFAFVASCNIGGESMAPDKLERLAALADITWQRHFDDSLGLSPLEASRKTTAGPLPVTEPLLADKPEHIIKRERSTDYPPEYGINMNIPENMYNQGELYNLSISRGTLTAEDRFKINEHMISTIKMLEGLPFPEELKNVPRFASTHHETMDGRGYPRRLSAKELSIPERILAIADVFEALTAKDRPYKKAKTISEAIDILHRMVDNNHLDRDCFELFLREDIYLQYAHRFLEADQIDHVDTSRYLQLGETA